MDAFVQFSDLTGIRLNEQDFFIEGHQVNPWDLYRTVSLRNGFDSVRLHDRTISFFPLMETLISSGLGDYEWGMVHGRR